MSALETVGFPDAGGRGGALAHVYSRSPQVKGIIAVPGNDLMHLNVREGVRFERYPAKLVEENARQIAELLRGKATMVDVCQDDIVKGGGVNFLREMGMPVVGPTKEAGRVEWDKPWSREFMRECGIPHPEFHTFHCEADGIAFIRAHEGRQWVIKAAGLALGKGVYVTSNSQEAEDGVRAMKKFGSAGETYLIEERLVGEEFSTYAVSDGEFHKILGSAQDHKPLLDNDEGPNTGGMGCGSSPLVLTPDIMTQVDVVLDKTFKGLAARGHPYTGVLYLGGMVVGGKVQVIEFNARWGDPEAQVVLPGLKTDLVDVSRAVIDRRIQELNLEFDNKVRIAIALASRGYPESSTKGKEIFGIDDARAQPGVTIYGAAVKRVDGHDYTDGGRLFYVVGEGSDVNYAREVAYGAMDRITVEDGAAQFRNDIGSRDVARLKKCS
jgi:phosphoribosylamine--glycine ligase